MLGGGAVASAFPNDALIRIMAAISVLSLLSAAFLVRAFEAGTPKARAPKVELAPLRRPWLISSIILCAALISGSHGFLTAFGSLHWIEKGLGDDFVALAWSVAIVADTLFYFAAARWFGGERHASGLIVAGAAGAVCRWLLLAADPGPAGIMLAQSLGALSGGALTLGPAYLLAELGGRAYTARVHGWLSAANGVTLSASLYASGWLNAAYGQQGYVAMAGIAGVALIAALALAAATRHDLRRDKEKAPAAQAARAVAEEDAL
jgi:PPP family 3-phenylpropionic acid transporter